MDNLQYYLKEKRNLHLQSLLCFKPYYKWITFNTNAEEMCEHYGVKF